MRGGNGEGYQASKRREPRITWEMLRVGVEGTRGEMEGVRLVGDEMPMGMGWSLVGMLDDSEMIWFGTEVGMGFTILDFEADKDCGIVSVPVSVPDVDDLFDL